MVSIIKSLLLLLLFTCHLQVFAGGTFLISGSSLTPSITVQLTNSISQTLKKNLQEQAAHVLSLHMVANGIAESIPVSGKYELTGNRLSYTPYYPLGQNRDFEIWYISAAATIKQRYHTNEQNASMRLAKPIQVFPLTNTIPANILSFHIRFSQPMFKNPQAYKYVNIYSVGGTPITRVWRQRSQWLDSGRLLLLMIHPGRVKSGIHYIGPVFEVGKKYSLKLEPGLKDRNGDPVQDTIVKTFTVKGEDRQLPGIEKVNATKNNTVLISFSEGMDIGTVTEGIKLLDKFGNNIPCRIRETKNGRIICVRPCMPVKKGAYTLRFYKIVADLAANRLTRPFEITDLKQKQNEPEFVSKSFVIK